MKKIHKIALNAICICMVFAFMASFTVNADDTVLRDENPYRIQVITGVNAEGDVYEINDDEVVFKMKKVMPTFNDKEPIKVVNFRRWADGTEVTDTTSYTEYLTGKSGYTYGRYGADAAYLGTYEKDGKTVVRFMLSGVIGEVDASKVQIVNLADMEVFSLYKVENGRLMHYIAQNMETPGWATQLDNGPAPSSLKSGTDYYSYDGHYFYTDYAVMLEDYKAGSRTSSVNANAPYFNYYQFLPLRSQTAYSGEELNTLLNNKINNTYSEEKAATSKMLNQGKAFVNQQNTYGVNALISASLAANESAWGTSSICQQKNNLFGLNAVDSSPGTSADTFESPEACIRDFADGWMSRGYLYPNDSRYFGGLLGNKACGINVKYASDPYWGEKAATHAYALDKQGGNKDCGTYSIGIKKDLYSTDSLEDRYDVNVRKGNSTSSTVIYKTGLSIGYSVLLRSTTASNDFYHIQSDGVLASDGSVTKETGVYSFDSMTAYISSGYLYIANSGDNISDHKHTYGTPTFNWSEDYSSCVATFKCTDGDDEKKINCTVTSKTVSSACTEPGEITYTATVTFQEKTYTDTMMKEVEAVGHSYGNPTFVWTSDRSICIATFTCKNGDDEQEVQCDITSEVTPATCTTQGKTVYTATATFEGNTYTNKKEDNIPATGHDYVNGACQYCGTRPIVRIYGTTRFDTSFAVANALKDELGISKFDSVIIANGMNFADALSGSYLAGVKKAPILMTDGKNANALKSYISENMNANGTIYILGGQYAVPESIEKSFSGYTIKRIAGTDRYDTNIKILKEAGIGNNPILICNGDSFADSLSASGTKKPILLVGKKLTNGQKTLLGESSGNFFILGGTKAVSSSIENEVEKYGTADRIGGTTRFDTSVLIAEKFFNNPDSVVLTYGMNFPDGLCGGALAISMKAPLILTSDDSLSAARDYVDNNSIEACAVLGGPSLISDRSVRKIMNLDSSYEISVYK